MMVVLQAPPGAAPGPAPFHEVGGYRRTSSNDVSIVNLPPFEGERMSHRWLDLYQARFQLHAIQVLEIHARGSLQLGA